MGSLDGTVTTLESVRDTWWWRFWTGTHITIADPYTPHNWFFIAAPQPHKPFLFRYGPSPMYFDWI